MQEVVPSVSRAFCGHTSMIWPWDAELVSEAMPGPSALKRLLGEENPPPKSIPLPKLPQRGPSAWNPPFGCWSHLFRTSPSLEHCFHSNQSSLQGAGTLERGGFLAPECLKRGP